MKSQDILFFIILVLLFWKRSPRLFVWSGLLCLLFAIPLFSFWVFFTAERLVWYAAAFFIVAILLFIRDKNVLQ